MTVLRLLLSESALSLCWNLEQNRWYDKRNWVNLECCVPIYRGLQPTLVNLEQVQPSLFLFGKAASASNSMRCNSDSLNRIGLRSLTPPRPLLPAEMPQGRYALVPTKNSIRSIEACHSTGETDCGLGCFLPSSLFAASRSLRIAGPLYSTLSLRLDPSPQSSRQPDEAQGVTELRLGMKR